LTNIQTSAKAIFHGVGRKKASNRTSKILIFTPKT